MKAKRQLLKDSTAFQRKSKERSLSMMRTIFLPTAYLSMILQQDKMADTIPSKIDAESTSTRKSARLLLQVSILDAEVPENKLRRPFGGPLEYTWRESNIPY